MKLLLVERMKGIHVAETWPLKLDEPITLTIIESLGQFSSYIEGDQVSAGCETLEEAAVELTRKVEEIYGSLHSIATLERDAALPAPERVKVTDSSFKPLITLVEENEPTHRNKLSPVHSPQRRPAASWNNAINWNTGAVAASIVAIFAIFTGATIYGGFDDVLQTLKPISPNINLADMPGYEIGVEVSHISMMQTARQNTEAVVRTISVTPDAANIIANEPPSSSVVRTVPNSGPFQPQAGPNIKTVVTSAIERLAPTSSVVQTVEPTAAAIVAGVAPAEKDIVKTIDWSITTTAFKTTSAKSLLAPAPAKKPALKADKDADQPQSVSAWQKFFGFEN